MEKLLRLVVVPGLAVLGLVFLGLVWWYFYGPTESSVGNNSGSPGRRFSRFLLRFAMEDLRFCLVFQSHQDGQLFLAVQCYYRHHTVEKQTHYNTCHYRDTNRKYLSSTITRCRAITVRTTIPS